MEYRFFIVLFFFISLKIEATPADMLPPDTLAVSTCEGSLSTYTDDDLHQLINNVVDGMKVDFGKVAHDSLESMRLKWNNRLGDKTFFVSTTQGTWVPEPFPTLSDKLRSLLAEPQTQTDSIDKICGWIASRYPFGDPDPDPNYATRNPDSTWILMNQGNLQGHCGELSAFFSRIVDVYYPHWGTPIMFASFPDTNISQGGRNPGHQWMGLANNKGKVWVVCDPSLGGIVRDSITGKALSLDEVQKFLRNPNTCHRPFIHHPATSFQTWGEGCIFAVMLSDYSDLIYYPTPIEIVEGHWKGLEASSPICTPYWLKRGFPRMTFMDVYLDIVDAYGSPNAENIIQTVRKNYLKK